MARRLIELLNDPGKSQRFGVAGRRHVVDHWSLDHMVEGYEELIERIYDRKTGMPSGVSTGIASERN